MRFALTILTLNAIVLTTSASYAAKAGRIQDVIFEGRDKTLEFTFTATSEIDASRAEALPDKSGRVLILRIGGVTV